MNSPHRTRIKLQPGHYDRWSSHKHLLTQGLLTNKDLAIYTHAGSRAVKNIAFDDSQREQIDHIALQKSP